MKPSWLWMAAAVLLTATALPTRAQQDAAPAGPDFALGSGVALDAEGYLKPIAILEQKDFGDLGPAARENFEHLGVRTKLALDGQLRDAARFRANYLLDYNEVNQSERTADPDANQGTLRQIEAYVDLLGDSTRWRIGAQQKNHLYQLNGVYDPTYRFTPYDGAFQAYDLEAGQIPETGVAWRWDYAGAHHLTLTYVPVSGVNGFSATLGGFYNFLGYEVQRPDANTSNSKYVFEAGGTAGGLTYLLSYIDGLNPAPDFEPNGDLVVDSEDNIERPDADGNPNTRDPDGVLEYNRYRSPGLDLTYAFTESTSVLLDAVYYDTPDVPEDEETFKQQDWYEYVVGLRTRYVGTHQLDLHVGQKVVPGIESTDDADLSDPTGRRLFFQGGLLSQPRETTQVVSMQLAGRFGAEGWLAYDLDTLHNWNTEGDVVRERYRLTLTAYLDPTESLLVRLRPEFDRNREITTKRYWAEAALRY